MPDAAQQRLDVGRVAQIEPLIDGDVAQHPLVALGGERCRFAGVRRVVVR